jgi:hypothetical protein
MERIFPVGLHQGTEKVGNLVRRKGPAIAGLIVIPATAGLLALAAGTDQNIAQGLGDILARGTRGNA